LPKIKRFAPPHFWAGYATGSTENCILSLGVNVQKSLRTTELDEQKCTQKIGILPGPTK